MICLARKSCRPEQSLRGMVCAVRGLALVSQASPEGQYVPAAFAGVSKDVRSLSFARNFKDRRFLLLALGIN